MKANCNLVLIMNRKELASKIPREELPVIIIEDAGLTQIEPGTTIVKFGIGPGKSVN